MAMAICPEMGIAQDQAQPDPRNELREIRQRLSELEKKLDDERKARESGAPTVTTALKGSKVRIDGRIFAGIFDTGAQGPYPNWSTDVSDAKLRFTFLPAENVTVVTRLSANSLKNPEFDYFYADFARALRPSNTFRLGQRKIDVGQETLADNPVENMLITNSISHVSGYGIGLAALGRLGGPESPLYEIGFVNGPKGVLTRPSTGLPVNVKIGTPLPYNLFASASFFTTGSLGGSDLSAISVAEVNSAPTGATSWSRDLWEIDLRYNYGPSGIRSLIPTGTLPPVMLGLTYGRFDDSATGAPGRGGSYWFAEGLVRLSPKMWAAARYSTTDLGAGQLAKLGKSPVAVNSYARTSIGLGYALTELVQWKIECTNNNTSEGTPAPSLNQWATGIAAKF